MFCIPIIARNTEEAQKKMTKAEGLSDIFEIRLDLMETFDIPSIIQGAGKPILVTYRSEKEGGKGGADPETVSDYLIAAIRSGADLVDVELSMSRKWRQKIIGSREGCDIVVSTHINDRTPSHLKLQKIFKESVATGASIVKVVTWAKEWDDNLRVLDLIPQARENGIRIIAFCMGPLGRISRIVSHLMGSHLTWTSLKAGQESAAGQVPIDEMKKILEYFTI